jgi:hypothetical protein
MANLSFKGSIIMKNLTLFSALMLALVGTANSAGVHTYDIKKPEPVDQHLVKIGYVEVSDGLFQSEGGKGKGFVALTASARASMAAKITDLRNRYQASAGSDGVSAGEQRVLKAFDDSVARMRKSAQSSKTVVNRGECGSGAQIAAGASAINGNSAMAAAGVTIDFGPTTPTGNYALAVTDNAYDVSFGEGSDWAQASAYSYGSCISYAYASVSCPDGGYLDAVEYSVDPYTICQPL